MERLRFLGVVFDVKLAFVLRCLRAKCGRVLQLLCVVARAVSGADWCTLIKLYGSLFCSRLDCASFCICGNQLRMGVGWGSCKKILSITCHQGAQIAAQCFQNIPSGELVYGGRWGPFTSAAC